MNFVFSRHSLEQAKNRNIPEISVTKVVENPGKIIDFDECVKIYQSIIESEKPYILRVFLNVCKEPAVVITVYKTSKIAKYHES